MRYLKDIRDGEQIIGHYLCKQKQTLKSRAGKPYISLKLQDKTGLVDGKIWDIHNEIDEFDENCFVKIDGVVSVFQGEYQISIRRLRMSMEGEYDPMDYIPCTEKDINGMIEKIKEYINKVENVYIKKLLQSFFVSDEEFLKKFTSHSAARSVHHSYMGGLLEHTLSVVEYAEFLANHYTGVNRDIVIAGAMLHDIGKIEELSEFPLNDYTDFGQLLGHIMIGVEMVTQKINIIKDFPDSLAALIKHCILSHHGEFEYGSPKRPKTIEAMIIHCADNTDAKIKLFEEAIKVEHPKGNWVGYNRMLGRNIRRSDF
ncbi:3'-5' exoribonuclease YhaM family protein [Defluviitalea phaphyphila]|uniref:3'-5' exoribonuclease YhaM family protein n=1 Tax=Defluviitalea phaphyphila TaxID=1473580 RepID=UPI000731751C|nr:HD domain-containing protein [Defluviitalea phaphyphila]